jgi:hypothetical protein
VIATVISVSDNIFVWTDIWNVTDNIFSVLAKQGANINIWENIIFEILNQHISAIHTYVWNVNDGIV